MGRRAAKISNQILEEASSWFIDFNENQVDQAGREAFNAWLRRSPECVRAFLQIAAFWEDADTFEKWSKIDTKGLIARSMAGKNVFHLGPLARDAKVITPSHAEVVSAADDELAPSNSDAVVVRRVRTTGWLAAAAVLLTLGIGMFAWYMVYITSTYITGIGEQRSITLEDGSVVELNVRSRLRVRFTEKQRSVELLEGQALFTVAKNPERPFVVTTTETRARAVGTQFDVYRKRSGTVVTVVKGRVAVDPLQIRARDVVSGRRSPDLKHSVAGRKLSEVLLAAGEQVTITPTDMAPPTSINTEVATAWTEKKLIFESAPLREVVEEFNRYNRRQLVIRDPELLGFHISGVFPSTDSVRMIEFLRQRFDVAMNSSSGEIEIYRRGGVMPSAGEMDIS